jgi:hypothetical protein
VESRFNLDGAVDQHLPAPVHPPADSGAPWTKPNYTCALPLDPGVDRAGKPSFTDQVEDEAEALGVGHVTNCADGFQKALPVQQVR